MAGSSLIWAAVFAISMWINLGFRVVKMTQRVEESVEDDIYIGEAWTDEGNVTELAAEESSSCSTLTAGCMLRLVNAERRKHGVNKVMRGENKLNRAAQVFAAEFAAYKNKGHSGANGSTPSSRAKEQGCKGGARENIAGNARDPKDLVRAWMNSDVHRANILCANCHQFGYAMKERTSGHMKGKYVHVAMFSSNC